MVNGYLRIQCLRERIYMKHYDLRHLSIMYLISRFHWILFLFLVQLQNVQMCAFCLLKIIEKFLVIYPNVYINN